MLCQLKNFQLREFAKVYFINKNIQKCKFSQLAVSAYGNNTTYKNTILITQYPLFSAFAQHSVADDVCE